MKRAIITGVSRGLGKALAETCLDQGWNVLGIGRSTDIQSGGFDFEERDLSEQIEFNFLDAYLDGATEILLINNAGILGEVRRISDQEETDIRKVFEVNFLAAVELSHALLKARRPEQKVSIVNISSGAGRRAIPSWAAYGSSKAALDHFSLILQEEENEKGSNTRIHSLAPGVVDTGMQEQIRKVSPEDFSAVDNFHQLKETNSLRQAEDVAQNLLKRLSDGTLEVVDRLS
ncbi:MAG: SDR family NAD(P)-dependent oxidoreductase [Bacteroidetes bacterium]|nr:MAG: SDR family NAD(P)-dependent oxidoreductase [Bacteroidota bacterium]